MAPELSFYLYLLLLLAADLALGDPRWRIHPVRGIGRLCELYESWTRRRLPWLNARIQGICSFLLVLSTTVLVTAGSLYLLNRLDRSAAIIGAVGIVFFGIAAGDLLQHSQRVLKLLHRNDTTGARGAVAMMVGRETEGLDAADISRACIESVCENSVDGVTAPLFWTFVFSLLGGGFFAEPLIGGAIGIAAYKAVNTMDSMYGYTNERYAEFGWAAARFDDFCNFIPARLTGVCLVGAAFLPGFDGFGAARVFAGDRLKSSSPNSGYPEAAASGALGVQLGGESVYFGQSTIKPIIGAGLAAAGTDDIGRANRLVMCGTLIFFTLCCLAHLFASRIL